MSTWMCPEGKHEMSKENVRYRRFKDSGKTRAYCIACYDEKHPRVADALGVSDEVQVEVSRAED